MAEGERPYYEAYDDRYRTVHSAGESWFSPEPTPIVREVLARYGVPAAARLLELGCGEGRDALPLLRAGWDLPATDVSPAAIAWCRIRAPEFAGRFRVLDAVAGSLPEQYDFIFAVAVVHMLVPDGDRRAFYGFVRDHLASGGLGLVCSMGDGSEERQTDIRRAFSPAERQGKSGPVTVAATSCRMVTADTFRREMENCGLAVREQGLTAAEPDFPVMLYAVVNKL